MKDLTLQTSLQEAEPSFPELIDAFYGAITDFYQGVDLEEEVESMTTTTVMPNFSGPNPLHFLAELRDRIPEIDTSMAELVFPRYHNDSASYTFIDCLADVVDYVSDR
ncbi:hypothetical protein CL619_04895 [archaeon]|nr:hypothetical protein [archaeon]